MTAPERGALTSLSLAQFTTTLEFTIVFIALPSTGRELGLGPVGLAWVVGGYAVAFGGLLVLGGRIADRVGHRRLFLAAATGFGLASGLGALAGSGPVLLTARVAQGVAAAMLQPAVLGLVQTSFLAEPARGRAWAVWSAVGAAGLAAGALIGGVLTSASWGWTFAINVPLMGACVLGARSWIGPDRPEDARAAPVPVTAAALGTGTAVAVALGLTLASEEGWGSPASSGVLVGAGVLAVAFLRHERAGRPLVDPALRPLGSLWLGAGATALYMASVGSAYYLLTLLLQDVWGDTAFAAGLGFLPLAVLVTAGSATAASLGRRLGPGPVLATGFAVGAVGLVWLAGTSGTFSYPVLLPGLLLSGFGNGLVFTSMFVVGTRDVPDTGRATAGGLLATSQYLASTLALAVATLVLGDHPTTTSFRDGFLLLAVAAGGGVVLAVPIRRMDR